MRFSNYFSINSVVVTIIRKSLFILLALYILGCESDLQKIEAITKEADYPSLSGKEVNILYTDSAKIKSKIYAKELYRYTLLQDEPYYEFPKGIHVLLYNADGELEAELSAEYAKHFEKEQLWEARNNVILKKISDSTTLKSEEVFWEMERHRIYSKTYTKALTPNGIYTGKNGFESNEDFSEWKLIGSTAEVNLKDEN